METGVIKRLIKYLSGYQRKQIRSALRAYMFQDPYEITAHIALPYCISFKKPAREFIFVFKPYLHKCILVIDIGSIKSLIDKRIKVKILHINHRSQSLPIGQVFLTGTQLPEVKPKSFMQEIKCVIADRILKGIVGLCITGIYEDTLGRTDNLRLYVHAHILPQGYPMPQVLA